MFRCPACDKQLPATPEPGTPCPQCGAEMVPVPDPQLDPAWVAEKEAKQAAFAAEQDRKPPSKLTAWLILGGVMIAGVVVMVLLVMQRQPNAKGEALQGVELTVTSKLPGVPFTVDGAKAGKTPQALKIKGSRTKALVIKGNGVTRTVTPDHDQVITLDP